LPVFHQRHLACPFDVIEGPDFLAEASAVVSMAPEVPYVVKLHTPYYLVKKLNKLPLTATKIREQLRLLWYVLKTHDFRALIPHERDIFIREWRNLRRADEVVAPSRAIAKAVRGMWIINPSRISLVPLVYEPSLELLNIPIETNTRRITFVGRIEQRKGVEDLAQAIPRVLALQPDARFRFVGAIGTSADSSLDMETAILNHVPEKYRSRIEFTGGVPPHDIPRYLADTDICVFPSRWESFGFVVLEAMSAGRAIICTGNAGMAELLHHGEYGLLVPPLKPRAIARSIVRLLTNSPLRHRFGRKARHEGLRRYSTSAIAPLQLDSYERAIAHKAKKSVSAPTRFRLFQHN
jgi:glycosyltransferase involved in cell wall biosynthesis